ncbi:MAG: sigma-70 family RNA polymerase sigma factor [Moorellaceae bacterium]
MEQIIIQYGNSVLRLAYFYLQDRGMAEDIAQEVFLRVWQKLPTFRGESDLKSWILRIAANLCKDRLRSWSWRRVRLMEEEFWETLPVGANPSAQTLAREKQAVLVREVMRLPVKYREVVVLFYYHGLDSREIALVLDSKEGTVRNRLARARAILKKSLLKEGITGA